MDLVQPADSSARLSVRTEARSTPASNPSPLEAEVKLLFDELRVPVLRYLMTLGLSPPDADEVVQDVFLALFQHLRRGKPRSNLPGWVFRVAHNLALKRRHANRSGETVLADAGDAAGHLDAAPNPEEQAVQRQRQARLLAVVRALPEQDRCCLHLRAEGLRYREIAKVLGVSLGAVSLSLQRALARLTRADGY
ncbi:MAG: sigma-70 family RNA polymerase sigma factor [Bryobacterales bacterium]